MSTNIDARGMLCPQPLIVTKKALDSLSEGVVTTIVDNTVAKENVVKYAIANHCGVSVDEQGGHYYIKITKGTPREGQTQLLAEPTGEVVYLITQDKLGHGSEELGEVLMKAFLYTVLQVGPLPRAMLFINSGVRLTTGKSPANDHLQALAQQGVIIQSCGTCLDYYGLKDDLTVGGVSNMYSILEELTGATKAITL